MLLLSSLHSRRKHGTAAADALLGELISVLSTPKSLVGRSFGQLVGLLVSPSVGWTVCGSAFRSVVRSVGWMVCGSAAPSIGWSVGCMIFWSAGLLVCWLYDLLVRH